MISATKEHIFLQFSKKILKKVMFFNSLSKIYALTKEIFFSNEGVNFSW